MSASTVQIENVRIHQFRSLKDVETTLSERKLLIGANNAGKTSFLRALTLALGEGRKFWSRDDLFIDGQGIVPSDGKMWVDVMVKPLVGEEFPEILHLPFNGLSRMAPFMRWTKTRICSGACRAPKR